MHTDKIGKTNDPRRKTALFRFLSTAAIVILAGSQPLMAGQDWTPQIHEPQATLAAPVQQQAINVRVQENGILADTTTAFLAQSLKLEKAGPLLPEGWTRARSNRNFAYRYVIENNATSYANATVTVRDLVNDRQYATRDLLLPDSRAPWSIMVDVDKSGLFATIKAIDSANKSFTVGFHFATGHRGSIAPSNPIFMEWGYQYGVYNHYVMNLMTGESWYMAQSFNHSYYYFKDVSPDGTWAVFDYYGYGPSNYRSYFIPLGNPKASTYTTALLQNLRFIGGHTALVTKPSVLTPSFYEENGIQETVVLDPLARTEKVLHYSVSENNTAILRQNKILVFPTYNQIHIFDASRGLGNLRLIKSDVVLPGQGTYRNIGFYDLRRIGGRQAVVSLSYVAYDYDTPADCSDVTRCQSLVINTVTGRTLELAGRIAAVRYYGMMARYTLQNGKGTVTIWIDLRTMEIMRNATGSWLKRSKSRRAENLRPLG